jgi:hypothetical protein
MMKKGNFLIVFVLLLLMIPIKTLDGSIFKDNSLLIIGPSISKHSAGFEHLNQKHPGFGAEFQVDYKKWVVGLHGYYMFEDSWNQKSYWTGLTGGIRIGDKNSLWCKPFLLVGGISKKQYNEGKFSVFALPGVAIGYKGVGVNISYIPRIPDVTEPLWIFQIKFRVW